MHLAYLGAEVIKVESRAHLDLMRRLPISPKGIKPGIDSSGPFNQWNQGKKSVELNLGKAEGIALAKELVQHCDVVVENFATGVMDNLGLGYEELKKLKPDLIMVSISGYGHTGPLKDYMGYGPAIPPITGLSALTGYPGGPHKNWACLSVILTRASPAAMANLLPRWQRASAPDKVSISMWRSGALQRVGGRRMDGHAMNGVEPQRQGNRDIWMAPHNCFRCLGEDKWVAIACSTEEEWQALCRVMDQVQLLEDSRFRTRVTAKRTKTNWTS
jgi:benzylsuccinate CoA-transferase BbsF subunit